MSLPLPNPFTGSMLDKAAFDAGFDEAVGVEGAWRTYRSSQCTMTLWLTCIGESLYYAAFSFENVHGGLAELGTAYLSPLPEGAKGARGTTTLAALRAMLRRAYQLAVSLPDAPLVLFLKETASLPKTTEVERLVVQRKGQEIFRKSLMAYWNGRCCMSGLDISPLLRASHIVPWSVATDAERLDVYNGLLLAPHLDALFDQHLMSIDDAGLVTMAARLPMNARMALGVNSGLQILEPHRLKPEHQVYLARHRTRVGELDSAGPR